MITQSRLKEVFHYEPSTGQFTWLLPTTNRVKAGELAGHVDERGRFLIGVDGENVLRHRLAWIYMTGEPPPPVIDHRNGVCHDDRWENLREATQSENLGNKRRHKNNTSGVKGVSYSQKRRKWVAMITKDRKAHNLGRYSSIDDAKAAYAAAARQLFGEFARID